MQFEWDPRKDRANVAKHGVAFAEAARAFGDPLSVVVPDPDHSVGEARYILFGRADTGRYLVVGFTERGARLRLISARPMTRRERTAYEQ
jgi:hypothetical protein